ncbi:MAG: hypothetical protein WA823_20570 [Candidatus Acidiferrales bacterium]
MIFATGKNKTATRRRGRSKIFRARFSVALAVAIPSTAAISAAALAPTPATTTTTTAPTATAAIAAAGSTAFPLRTRFVDHQRAAQEILSVEGFDRFFGFGIIRELRKTKPARLAGETVAQ